MLTFRRHLWTLTPISVFQVVIIVDVASPDQIPQLMAHFTESPFYSRFRSKRQEDQQECITSVVHHLCGEGILEDERYKEFMDGFPESVQVSIACRNAY